MFEYYFYPKAIIGLGLFCGTALMMIVSYVVCFVLLEGYYKAPWQWLRDALRYDSVKELLGKTEEMLLQASLPRLWIGTEHFAYQGPLLSLVWMWGILVLLLGLVLYPVRAFLYLLRRYVVRPLWLLMPWLRPTLAFLFLSIVMDPMTCAIMMQPAGVHRLDKNGWRIFHGSVFVSNATWGLMVWTGVETLQALAPGLWEKLEAFF